MSDETFPYRLLGRLQNDCEYYLGAGGRSPGVLWAGDENSQITKMRELWHGFSESEKPGWITLGKITEYELQMLGHSSEQIETQVVHTLKKSSGPRA